MHAVESTSELGILSLTADSREDTASLRSAVQRIRWLPGVLAVENAGGELQVVFREPSDGLLRRIHQAMTADGDREFTIS